jgi:hypothetical protein
MPGRIFSDHWAQHSLPLLLKSLNIEQQNKEPQNHEVITSSFDIPCSIFCGLKDGGGFSRLARAIAT